MKSKHNMYEPVFMTSFLKFTTQREESISLDKNRPHSDIASSATNKNKKASVVILLYSDTIIDQ